MDKKQIEQLESWDRTSVWHAFTQMQTYKPFIIREAEGCYLTDIHGKRYLDAESSLWCNVHGHRHPELDQAIREQLDRVAHVTLLGMSCDTTVQLAQRLATLAPGSLNHVFFSSDGACANEVAMKMAYQYWRHIEPTSQKHKFLCFDAAYHGDTIGTVSVGGVDRFNAIFAPLLLETIKGPIPDTYRLPPNVASENAAAHYLAITEQLLQKHHEEIAACIMEPLIQCAAGIVTHPPGFLRGIERLCRKYNILLIADEIAVGFGRTGTLFACEQEGIEPDFLCLGKGLTAGYLPMSATLTQERIWNSFLGSDADNNAFFHGHTYGGSPLAAAVALRNLDLFDQHSVLPRVNEAGKYLRECLAPLEQHPHVGDIRHRGLIFGIELVQDRGSRQRFAWQDRIGTRVCQKATEKGVWLRPLEDTVVIMPPLVISDEQLELTAKALIESVDEVIHDHASGEGV